MAISNQLNVTKNLNSVQQKNGDLGKENRREFPEAEGKI